MSEKKSGFLSLRVRPWGLLSGAGLVLCLSTLFGFLGRFSWFLDLFSHFRVQYLLSLVLISLIFFLGRRRKTAAILIAFAGINLAVVLPFFFGDRNTEPEPDSRATLRAMLLNVNTRQGDPERVRQAILEIDPDILVLEEISAQWILELNPLSESHPHSCVRPREDNFGIGLFSKFPLADEEIVFIGGEVPSILAIVETGRGSVRILATHPLPPSGAAYSRLRNVQFEALPDYARSPLPLMLLGDLNATPWNFHFKKMLDRTGLIDSSKGRGIQPTWPSQIPLLLIPLDHCLHSADIDVLSRKIGAGVGSDHYPVIVDFVIGTE